MWTNTFGFRVNTLPKNLDPTSSPVSNDTALVLDLLAPWVHKTRQPSKYYKYSFFCMRASGGFPKFLIQSEHKTDFWIRHPWGITADTYSGRHVKWTKLWVSNGPPPMILVTLQMISGTWNDFHNMFDHLNNKPPIVNSQTFIRVIPVKSQSCGYV